MGEASYSHRTDCLWRRALDGVLVLGADADDPIHIGGSGALAWELLSEPLTVTEVVTRLAEVFDLAPEALVEQVQDLLVDLERQGLLSCEPSGTPNPDGQ